MGRRTSQHWAPTAVSQPPGRGTGGRLGRAQPSGPRDWGGWLAARPQECSESACGPCWECGAFRVRGGGRRARGLTRSAGEPETEADRALGGRRQRAGQGPHPAGARCCGSRPAQTRPAGHDGSLSLPLAGPELLGAHRRMQTGFRTQWQVGSCPAPLLRGSRYLGTGGAWAPGEVFPTD